MARQNVVEQDEQQNEQAELDPKDPKAVMERLKKSIKVEVSDTGVLRKTLAVRVPRDEIQSELDQQYGEIISDAIVPGFRRGRAPRRLVEKRFGSEVGAQVQTRLVSNAYLAAVEMNDLKVLGDPLVWVSRKDKKASEAAAREELLDMATAMEHLKLPEEGDFEFRCEVEVKPGFELPELDGIPVEKPLVTITDDDVSAEVDRARARRGHFAPVEGGPVEEDDIVIGDLVMTVNGEEIKREENYTLASRGRVLEGVTVENLGDILDGGKVGETKSFEGPLPDDHAREDLRGKTAKFTFTIADIKRFTLPPLDEEFLKAQGFDSEDELRNWFRQQMEPRLEQEIRRGMRNQVRKYLLDNVKLELPEGLSSRQTDRAVLRRVVDLRRRGVPMSEIEKHADELRTSAKEEVLTELKLYFILEQIAEKSEVEVSEEEINAQIAEIAREYGRRFDRVRDELVRENGIESLYLQIRDEKCIDSLLEKAKVTEARVEPALAARKGAAKKKKEEPAEEAPAAKKASAEGASKKAVAAEEAKPKKKAAKKKSDD